jgi:hypothetical protein
MPTYALSDNEKTLKLDHIARIADCAASPAMVEAGRFFGLTLASGVNSDPRSKLKLGFLGNSSGRHRAGPQIPRAHLTTTAGQAPVNVLQTGRRARGCGQIALRMRQDGQDALAGFRPRSWGLLAVGHAQVGVACHTPTRFIV